MKYRLIFLLVAAALMVTSLAGCKDTPEKDAEETLPENTIVTPQIIEEIVSDGIFTMKYEPDAGFNPIRCSNKHNLVLTSLMYESLFVLDSGFTAQPVLCKEYSTEDGITYKFEVLQDIRMSDGSTLNSTDAAYSINRARISERFMKRLEGIESASVTGDYTFEIVLTSPNYNLPALLDVPVIKYESLEMSAPPGTGPYQYNGSDTEPKLVPFSEHRNYVAGGLAEIYLSDIAASKIAGEFSEQRIDLYETDPSSSDEMVIRTDHEIRFYDTTVMQYLGFNLSNTLLDDPELRYAMSLAVDREYITKKIMSGNVWASPLLFSPAWYLYEKDWEKGTDYSVTELVDRLTALGMDDRDNDGYLEYSREGVFSVFELTLIVNDESTDKVAAAQKIASTLDRVGIKVNLRELSWDDYVEALENNEYDLYYAETKLPADFDFSELFAQGGSLNYGAITNDLYSTMINAYKSAGTEELRKAAAKALCEFAKNNAHIVPILYKKMAVHSHRGIVTGFSPSQSGVFGITNGFKFDL